ncbi:MAG: AAA family ATPase [Anaerolineales bacterium]|nr:MAG: AAA family ATPase [Anaerolineales bacterium]
MGNPQDHLTPAERLIRLIEFGSAPVPTEPLPEEWMPFYDAVWQALETGPKGRWAALLATIQTREQRTMLSQLYDAQSLLPNRDHPAVIIYSAKDAFGPPPRIEWLIPNLLARPSLNILVGQPGSKKTLLALDLAACIALGKPWLGLPVEQTPAYLIDMETGRPRLWSRIHSALLAHGGSPDTPLYFQSLPIYDLQQEQHRRNIRNDADQLAAGLIIIDALSGLLRGADENNTASVFPILNNLRILSEQANAAVLVIHHMNKSGDFRGSSAIAAAVDLMLATHSSPQSPIVTLTPIKSREASPQPLSARAHFQPGRTWFTAEADPPPAITNLAPAAVKLLHHLHLNGPATTASIFTQLDSLSPSTLRHQIHQLKSAGYLARTNTGRQGATATYGLTPSSLALFSKERS